MQHQAVESEEVPCTGCRRALHLVTLALLPRLLLLGALFGVTGGFPGQVAHAAPAPASPGTSCVGASCR